MGSRNLSPLTPTLKEKEKEILNEARIHFRKNGFNGMNSFYKRKMDSWKNAPLKFAITGSSDKERSSFMNKLRWLMFYISLDMTDHHKGNFFYGNAFCVVICYFLVNFILSFYAKESKSAFNHMSVNSFLL